MIPPDENTWRVFKTTRLIALGMLVGIPVVYLVVAVLVVPGAFNPDAGNDMLFYILLVVAAVQPLLYHLLENTSISQFKQRHGEQAPRDRLFLALNITKLSFVAGIFVYGLVIYFISRSFDRLAWLYLIGAVWSVIMWPRRRQFEEFLARENEPL